MIGLMSQRPNKLILILVALALAVSPLRSALALPAAASTDSESHCTAMQHTGAMPGMHHPDSADAGQPCKAACSGDCCDSACKSTVNPASALLDGSLTPVSPYHPPLKITLSSRFSNRTVMPLLRPPASP
jgi:uncharacterized protein involved in copper resistance